MKNITIFHLRIIIFIIFTAVKYHSILHGHVGVMWSTGEYEKREYFIQTFSVFILLRLL